MDAHALLLAVDVWTAKTPTLVGEAILSLPDTAVWLSATPQHLFGLQCGNGWVTGGAVDGVDLSVYRTRAVHACTSTINNTVYVTVAKNSTATAMSIYEMRVVRAVQSATCIPCRSQAVVVSAVPNVPFLNATYSWEGLFQGTKSAMLDWSPMIINKCGGCRQAVGRQYYAFRSETKDIGNHVWMSLLCKAAGV